MNTEYFLEVYLIFRYNRGTPMESPLETLTLLRQKLLRLQEYL
jgi:hypothetical protein